MTAITHNETIGVNFQGLKRLISKHRNVAEDDALKDFPCVRSRGVFLTAQKDGDKMEGSDCDFTTLTKLKSDIAHLRTNGADTFYIEGGFDGADSVHELYDGYTPYVSDWCFEIKL